MTLLLIGISSGILISITAFVISWEETHKEAEGILYKRYNHD